VTHVIINTIQELNDLVDFLKSNQGILAFDLETDSVDEVKANIYGIGLALHEDEAYYIPIRSKDGSYFFGESTEEAYTVLNQLLAQSKLLGHNIIYDVLVYKANTGVDLTPNVYADTILMKHTVDEEPPFGLKDLAIKEFGEGADLAQQELYENIKANGGSTTKANMEMYKADTEVLGKYCAHDVMLTHKLFNLYSRKLEKEKLLEFFYEDEVMPLYREVTIPMKMSGVTLDTELLSSMSRDAEVDLKKLEDEVMRELNTLIEEYELTYLNENFPIKPTGNFPKAYAKIIGLGEITSVSKKAIELLQVETELQHEFKAWMKSEVSELTGPVEEAQRLLHFNKTEKEYIFNLSSKAQLKWLFFDKLGLDPLNKTETGEPQVDDAFLESVAKDYTWVNKLRDINTINKMKGTYLDGMLERAINGKIYTSFLQFGTTSGRFASRNPNLQNAPAPQNTGSIVDKYVNCVRDSIIAKPGYKLIGSDFSSLEPHIAAYVSGDPDLIDIFVTGKDFYSAIAIKQFKLNHLSAFKDDPNYLGNVDKAIRNRTKTYSLAAFYGAGGYRIAEVLNCEVEEANKLLEGYLDAFPGIRKFIETSHYDACTKGYVKTMFGRVRHLYEAKGMFDAYGHQLLDAKWARSKGLSEERRRFKNLMNNAVNFQIQGTAGHVMNRAMMLTNRTFKENNIDARIVMTIHDEQIIEVREDQAEVAAEIIKWAMENAVTLDPIKLKATPIIGNSYGECK